MRESFWMLLKFHTLTSVTDGLPLFGKYTRLLQQWSALLTSLSGAVLRGLGGNQVGQRIARCHYGTKFDEEYDPRRHNAGDKYWDTLYEKWFVANRMRWYIKKVSPRSRPQLSNSQ
jgi:hypothetical protein